MSEFKKARDEAANGKSVCSFDGFEQGADWARSWVLKNDPVVKGLAEALRKIGPMCFPQNNLDRDDLLNAEQALKNYATATGGGE